MAWRVEHNPLEGVLELLAENGLEDLREPMTILLNAAMKLERERHLGAAPWQRSPARVGHANGFKDRTLKTRVGELAAAQAKWQVGVGPPQRFGPSQVGVGPPQRFDLTW